LTERKDPDPGRAAVFRGSAANVAERFMFLIMRCSPLARQLQKNQANQGVGDAQTRCELDGASP